MDVIVEELDRSNPLSNDDMESNDAEGDLVNGGVDKTVGEASQRQRKAKSPRRAAKVTEAELRDIIEHTEHEEEEIKQLFKELSHTEAEIDEEEGEEHAGYEDHVCGCSYDVTTAWQSAVTKKHMMETPAAIKILGKMLGFRQVCHRHMRHTAGHIGLSTRAIGKQELLSRIQTLYQQRLSLGALKTNNDTYQWFRVAHRPARPSGALGPYKFAPDVITDDFTFDQKKILDAWDKTIGPEWDSQGSIIRPVFAWWLESPLKEEIYEETNMYLHHLREVNGRKNLGWLRNMFFSIAQQLMRQDITYYMLYACLRPDNAWRLCSYPYYSKYSLPGDKKKNAHIDLNIPDLVQQKRGYAMIQGTVSLDEEDKENCTFILPGIQHRLGEWWAKVEERGLETNGFVHRIDNRMWTKEDVKEFRTDWKHVPCKPGDARITLPSIPHGSTGPTTKTRRTMLPWFVAIQEDESSLEVTEGGTWEDLLQAHRDFTAPKVTPYGLPHRYGTIPYRFPASMQLLGLGAISDALVCRLKWSSLAVRAERDLLLGTDRVAAHAFIKRWRENAILTATKAYQLMRQEEKRVFGSKSYYYHLERFQNEGIPMPVLELDADAMKGAEAEKR